MPPKSKAQARFMGAVIAGKARKKGPSKKVAREFLRGHKIKGLPKRKKSKRKKSKRKR